MPGAQEKLEFFRVKNVVLSLSVCVINPHVCASISLWSMSGFGGLRKHEKTQHALKSDRIISLFIDCGHHNCIGRRRVIPYHQRHCCDDHSRHPFLFLKNSPSSFKAFCFTDASYLLKSTDRSIMTVSVTLCSVSQSRTLYCLYTNEC